MYQRNAFSLLELILVLALLALLASIAVPTLKSWRDRIEIDRANGAFIEILGDAKLRAAREGNAWTIRSSVSPATLILEPRIKSTKDTLTETVKLPNSIQFEFYLLGTNEPLDFLTISSLGNLAPAQIRMTKNGQYVAFYESERLTGGIRRLR